MFESIGRGWAITKSSFEVLRKDKEILVLPVLSGVVLALIVLTFFGFLFVLPFDSSEGSFWVGVVGAFLFYTLAYFVVLFFNAAIVECATIRFNGGDPKVSDGLSKAWSRSGRILQWALVAATVGLLLKILEGMARNAKDDFTRLLGRISVALAGAAWSLAVYFVVPILLYKDVGPFDALKSSVRTWKGIWGEGAGSLVSTWGIFFVLGLLGLVPFFFGIALPSPVGPLLLLVTVLYWIALTVVKAAVDNILVAALYKYSVDRTLPEPFRGNPALLWSA